MSLRTSLDFALRQRLTWSPPAHERPEEPDPWQDDAERLLAEGYGLMGARQRMAAWRWRRNREVLQFLDRAGREPEVAALVKRPGPLAALDVGSKNFDYVDALGAFWTQGGQSLDLAGVELDAHRRYTDLRTRRAWADHYASFVSGARYLPSDVRDWTTPVEAVTWFHPFLTALPLKKWGLPTKYLRPQELLHHVLQLVVPGGVLVVANQTADEAELQHRLLDDEGQPYTDLGVVNGRPLLLVAKPLTPSPR